MTFRNYILFGITLVVVLTAGFLFAFSGINKLLAVGTALVIVAPMWMMGRPGWMHQRLDDRPQVEVKRIKPQTSLIAAVIGLCATAWNLVSYYRRGEWMRVGINVILTLWFLYIIYLTKQRWSKEKQSEDGSRVA